MDCLRHAAYRVAAVLLLALFVEVPALSAPMEANPSDEDFAHVKQDLFNETGIGATGFVSRQDIVTLQELLVIFRNGLPAEAPSVLTKLRYVRTCSQSLMEQSGALAYYEADKSAILVPGHSAFMRHPSANEVLSHYVALAHEIGHAMVFSGMGPDELLSAASQYGPWAAVPMHASSIYDDVFFAHHLLFNTSMGIPGRLTNTPSAYSLSNIHEWFAESTASVILCTLGNQGALGKQWRSSLGSDFFVSRPLREFIWSKLGGRDDPCHDPGPPT